MGKELKSKTAEGGCPSDISRKGAVTCIMVICQRGHCLVCALSGRVQDVLSARVQDAL